MTAVRIPGWDAIEMPPPHPLEPLLLERGVCVGHPNADWWTTDDQSTLPVRIRYEGKVRPANVSRSLLAKRECENCPVLKECRVVADHLERCGPGGGLDYRYFTGVRGGEGPAERAQRRLQGNFRAA